MTKGTVSANDFPAWEHLAKPAPHLREDGSTRPAIGTLRDELRQARNGFAPEALPDDFTRRLVASILADADAFGKLFEHCIRESRKGTADGD